MNSGNYDLRLSPVVAVLLIDDRREIVLEIADKCFSGLVFKFEAVHEEQNPLGVARPHEKLDHRSGGQGLPGAGGHFKQEPCSSIADGILKRGDSLELIGAQELQLRVFDIALTLGGVIPARVVRIVGVLRDGNIVGFDSFADEGVWIRLESVEVVQGLGIRKLCYEDGVALLQVPEVMQVAIGEDDKSNVPRVSVLPGLFLAHQRIEFLGFGFQDGHGKAPFVKQEVIDVAVSRLLEIIPKGI